MKKCEQAEKWLSERLLGLISPDQDKALTTHLQGCPACRMLAEKYTAAFAALQEKSEDVFDPYLAGRVLQIAQTQQSAAVPGRPYSWWLPVLAGAAALALVVVVTPRLINPPTVMSVQDIMDTYTEDMNALGFGEEVENNGVSDDFDYENYGVPAELLQYMI